MANGKKSFILYCDLIHTVNELPDDKAGELFKHILSYVNDENPITDDLITKIAFEPIKQQLKRDLKKYEGYIDKQRENGAKGGRPKKTQKTQAFNSKPKKADSVNVSDTVTDNVNVNDIKEIVNYLNVRLGTKYKHNSKATADPIRARLNEGYTVSDFKQVIDIKCKEWQSDEKFSKFLRPQTLFGTKFESYLNQQEATLSRDEEFEIAKLKHLRDVQSELDNINAAKPNRLRRLP